MLEAIALHDRTLRSHLTKFCGYEVQPVLPHSLLAVLRVAQMCMSCASCAVCPKTRKHGLVCVEEEQRG